MTRGFLSVALLGALAFALFDTGVRAEPLDAATCGLLKGEQVRMEQGGVRSSMDKGPAWAKSNLAADKLDQVRRLIELDEQLLFRCSARNLVELPPDADADPAAKADDEGKAPAPPKAGAPAAPTAKSKSGSAKNATAPAAKAQPKEAAKAAPEAAKAAPAKKKPEPAKAAAGSAPASDKAVPAKPKPKAKVDDAYKAPPPDPKVDPFANQPARQ